MTGDHDTLDDARAGRIRQHARGLKRVINATGFSLAGLRACWRQEEAFRQEVLVALIAVPVGLWLGATTVERVLLVGSWLLVLIVELLNSGVETLCDRVGIEPNELTRRAKDLGSAAVLMSLVLACVVWGLILWDQWMA